MALTMPHLTPHTTAIQPPPTTHTHIFTTTTTTLCRFVAPEEAAEAAEEAKRRRLCAVISSLLDMVSGSGVAKERALFMSLMKKEIDRVNAQIAASRSSAEGKCSQMCSQEESCACSCVVD